jgi:hypothetical protein
LTGVVAGLPCGRKRRLAGRFGQCRPPCRCRSKSVAICRCPVSRPTSATAFRIVQVVHRRDPPPERSALRAQRSGGGGRSLWTHLDNPGCE